MDEKKVREAIDFIKTLITAGNGDERLYTVIEALEKQLAKKVEYEGGYIDNGFTKYRMAKCPNCDRWHSSRDEIICCSKCGQRLDWSE